LAFLGEVVCVVDATAVRITRIDERTADLNMEVEKYPLDSVE
jgi:hypothetical protein